MNIPFNRPVVTGTEIEYLKEALKNHKFSGNGPFTKKCCQWLEDNLHCSKAIITTSCTHSLEMAAILADIKQDDEIIMPSYTFVSTANAFVLRGAKVVFVDVRPDTMNINESLIEAAITNKTRAIVAVHYAGVACEMDSILKIANRYNLLVIEDAAQGILSKYKGRFLGTIGHLGCFSFHETKNLTCGEGGALIINDERFTKRAEVIWEKGTNRSEFFRGQVDKYTWVDIGSSYLPSELNTAFLYSQLEMGEKIIRDRINSWSLYFEKLKPLQAVGLVQLPCIPEECEHNGHLFYIKTKDLKERSELIDYLSTRGISSVFHYIPLHNSPAGLCYGRFNGKDVYTSKESERLIRLPLFSYITESNITFITDTIVSFYLNINHKIANRLRSNRT